MRFESCYTAGMEQILRQDCTALILAGGRGTRLGGCDKALLLWRGQRFIDHQYIQLRRQFDTVWINRRIDDGAPADLPGPVCRDRFADHGPLAGIHAGLSQLATPWLMVVPCDAPRLSPALFDHLAGIETQPPHATHAPALLRYAHDGERDQYLFALLHASLLPSLSQYLRSGQRTVRHWYASQGAAAMDCRAIRDSFTNINSADHYEALRKI